MKKILLFISFILFLSECELLQAQPVICGSGDVKRWTGTGDPGDLGLGRAGFTGSNTFEIDGNIADWLEHITGPLNPAYTTAPIPTYQPDPFSSPLALRNIQLDGLRGQLSSSSDYDRDRPGQDHRDLRYFGYTFDQANMYFFFRRPGNNNAQVSFYYFLDINTDGFMKTGEPVLRVVYNGSTATITMMYYIENTSSNSYAAGSWISGKGNSMTATVNRTGTSSVSQWVIGSADGWSMPGSVAVPASGQVPTVSGVPVGGSLETFAAAAITTANNTGYAAEFAVPWRFLKLYSGTNPAPVSTPLDYTKIFTWHVSLDNGNGTNSDDDEDNAGGCCSGLAVTGDPAASSVPTFGPNPSGSLPYDYRLNISYTELAGVSTIVTLTKVVISNPKYSDDTEIPESKVKEWILTGYKDANCDGISEGSASFLYDPQLSDPDAKTYVFLPSILSVIIGPKPSTGPNPPGCIFVNFNTAPGGPPPFRRARIDYSSSLLFNIGSEPCDEELAENGIEGGLDALPVKLIYFNANRTGQNVNLTWETSIEEKNRGFDVQRFIGSGNWESIGFVSSKATDGYSSSALNYEFNDINNIKGITQYRLKLVDLDGKSGFSMIRSIRGEGQTGKTIIYPNPTNNGKVNVVFDDANVTRDVTLIDMNGRTIKQWRGTTNNNIQIENLNAGFYSVIILNKETGQQVVEKILVQKR